MNLEYQGLGPDERMLLSQLFREMGKEERGAPEIEMQDRGGVHHGAKSSFSFSTSGFRGTRTERAPRIYSSVL